MLLVTLCFTAVAAAEWRIDIESKTVAAGETGVTLGFTGYWDANMTSFVVLLAINIAIGFMPGSSIAWQAHVGGLLGGLVVGLIFMKTRMPNQRNAQIGLTAAFAGALVVLSFAFFVVSPVPGLLQ